MNIIPKPMGITVLTGPDGNLQSVVESLSPCDQANAAKSTDFQVSKPIMGRNRIAKKKTSNHAWYFAGRELKIMSILTCLLCTIVEAPPRRNMALNNIQAVSYTQSVGLFKTYLIRTS